MFTIFSNLSVSDDVILQMGDTGVYRVVTEKDMIEPERKGHHGELQWKRAS